MSEKLITCNYQGRLGNLMFEIAATLSAAWSNGLTPSFPKVYHHYYDDITAFKEYILPLLNNFHKHDPDTSFTRYDEPPDLRYVPIVTGDNTKLFGYFTTSLYFSRWRERITDLFTVFTEHTARVHELYSDLRNKHRGREIVTVHVRRTDYVTDYKWDLPVSYYAEAAKRFENPLYLIFSDEIAWCKQHLTFMHERAFFSAKDYIELLLMGMFDAHIIANSTFSAMSVILGDPYRNKKVIAPINWCPTHFNQHIYEAHWIKI